MGKRELVAWLSLSPWCLVIVEWFFLAVPWVCLQFVSVVFPDQTHLLFYIYIYYSKMSHSFKKSLTFINIDVAFSPRD